MILIDGEAEKSLTNQHQLNGVHIILLANSHYVSRPTSTINRINKFYTILICDMA